MTEKDLEIQQLRLRISALEKANIELLVEYDKAMAANAKLKAERDAAIADLIKYGSCDACKFGIIIDGKKEDYVQALKICRDCKPTDCKFEWRGVQR